MEFYEIKEKLNQIGIMQVSRDLYCNPNERGFVKSPVTKDKTYSCKLYPKTNTYCDFANGNHGGDIVSFVAYINGIGNVKAMQLLAGQYGFDDSDTMTKEERNRWIMERKRKQLLKQKRKIEFDTALVNLTGYLKKEYDFLKSKIKLYEPFSELWCKAVNEKQKISYQLDILCATDMYTYRRMHDKNGFTSERAIWLLHTLQIMHEYKVLDITKKEVLAAKKAVWNSLTNDKGVIVHD